MAKDAQWKRKKPEQCPHCKNLGNKIPNTYIELMTAFVCHPCRFHWAEAVPTHPVSETVKDCQEIENVSDDATEVDVLLSELWRKVDTFKLK